MSKAGERRRWKPRPQAVPGTSETSVRAEIFRVLYAQDGYASIGTAAIRIVTFFLPSYRWPETMGSMPAVRGRRVQGTASPSGWNRRKDNAARRLWSSTSRLAAVNCDRTGLHALRRIPDVQWRRFPLCLIRRRSRNDRIGLYFDLSVARPMDIMRGQVPQAACLIA